jgi:hypothetical protein
MWIDELHDVTLRSIVFEWKTAIVRIELAHGRTIIVEGVTSLVAPRTEEWGPSDSILEGTLATEGDSITLTLHIQSGDDIVVGGRVARLA